MGASIGNATGQAFSPIIFGTQQNPYGGTAGYNSSGTLLGGFNDFIQSMGGSATSGQSWGGLFGNVFGGRSGANYGNNNNAAVQSAYQDAMGNALNDAIMKFTGGGDSVPTSIG